VAYRLLNRLDMKTSTETTALETITSDSLDAVNGGWVGLGVGRAYAMAAQAAALSSLAYPAGPAPYYYGAPYAVAPLGYYRHWRR
jgi:hypothetical protein